MPEVLSPILQPILRAIRHDLLSASGGGGTSSPSVDYFAADLAMTGWYPNATHPPAIKIGNRTLFGFQRFNHSTGKLKNSSRFYNNLLGTWGPAVDIGDTSSGTDDHGVPSFCVDAGGYIHSFGGGHAEPMLHWVTSLPDDGVSDPVWVRQADIGTVYSYGKPIFVAANNNQISLIMRSSLATTEPLVVVQSTSIVNGAVTWAAEQALVDFGNGYSGSGSRTYGCNFEVHGTEIHMPIVFAPHDDSYRQDVYYIIYDTADGKVYKYDRSFNTAAGSLPVLLASMNTNYRIVNQSQGTADLNSEGQIVQLVYRANGDKEIIYIDGLAASSVRTINVISIVGGVLGSPVQIATTDTTCVHVAAREQADGSLEAWYTKTASDRGGNVFVTGGSVYRRVRTPAGVWGAEQLIQAGGKFYAWSAPERVYGGSDDCGIAICENIGSATIGIENGRALRAKAFNSAGNVVKVPWTAGTEGAAFFTRMTVQETWQQQAIFDNFIRQLVNIGFGSVAEFLNINAMATHQAAALDVFNRHNASEQGGIVLVPGAGYTPDGSNDGLDFGFNPSSAGGLRMGRDSAMVAVFSLDTFQSAAPALGTLAAAVPSISIVPRTTSNTMTARLDDGTSSPVSGNANTNGFGFYGVLRRSSTVKEFYHNVTQTIDSIASTGLPNGNVTGFRNLTLFDTRRIPMFIMCDGTPTRDMMFALENLTKRLVEDLGLA